MTEYSGFRFLIFFIGEFATAGVFAFIAAVLFLGGWGVPFSWFGWDTVAHRGIELIQQWVYEGAAEGNSADLLPLPKWSEDWQLGEPDLVVTMPESYALPAEGTDVYRNFVIPTKLTTDKWVRAIELKPAKTRAA